LNLFQGGRKGGRRFRVGESGPVHALAGPALAPNSAKVARRWSIPLVASDFPKKSGQEEATSYTALAFTRNLQIACGVYCSHNACRCKRRAPRMIFEICWRQITAGDNRAAILYLKLPARCDELLFSRTCRERERKALCCKFESTKCGDVFHIAFL